MSLAAQMTLCFWQSIGCARRVSQPPTLLMEGDFPLERRRLAAMQAPRVQLTDTSIQMYRKTAEAVLAPPWLMDRAAAWILSFVAGSRTAPVPGIDFLVQGRDWLPASAIAGTTWKDFAPQGAVQIFPQRKLQGRGRGRGRGRPRSTVAAPQAAHQSRRSQAEANVAQEIEAEALEEEDEDVVPPPCKRPAARTKADVKKRPASRR